MTYFGFLLKFIIIPILILSALTWQEFRRARPSQGFDIAKTPRIIAVHILLALIYTTPWDNYLVATGVWNYNPALVSGIILGYVPLEEYTFFILETLLTGLWWWFLARRLSLPHTEDFKPSVRTRLVSSGILLIAWFLFTWLLFFGSDSWKYLSITLFWALPPIFPQILFGADILWHYRKLVMWTILPMSLYLSFADIAALRATTWAISSTQTLDLVCFNILPLEEVIFFFITNTLICFGMTLMLAKPGWQRFSSWKSINFKGLPK